MTESYCLKSCTECGQCSGCRTGVYGAECEIAKCCKKTGHESCETCTRGAGCSTKWSRDRMPGLIHDKERRDAELREYYRKKVGLLVQWLPLVFWGMVVNMAFGLVYGVIEAIEPIAFPLELIVSAVCLLTMAFGYWRLNEADEQFRFAAIYHVLALVLNVAESYLPEKSVLASILGIVIGAIGIAVTFKTCAAFRDVMYGIDNQMAEKWDNQRTLYKYCCIGLVALLVLVWIPLIGVLAVYAVLFFMVFLSIREIVYVYQTMNLCQMRNWG